MGESDAASSGQRTVSRPGKLLLISGDPTTANLRKTAKDNGFPFAITPVERLREALDCLRRAQYVAILADIDLPDTEGLATVRALRSAAPDVPLIILGERHSAEMAVRCLHLGAQDYIGKARLGRIDLPRRVNNAIARQRRAATTQQVVTSLEARISRRHAELGQARIALAHETAQRTEAEDALWEYSERLRLQRRLDRAILSGVAADFIADVVLDALRRSDSCRLAAVILFDFASAESIVFAISAADPGQLRAGARFPLAANLTVPDPGVLRANLIGDLDSSPAQQQLLRGLKNSGIRAVFSVPLTANGVLIGCLILGMDRPAPLPDQQEEKAIELADKLALAFSRQPHPANPAQADQAASAPAHSQLVAGTAVATALLLQEFAARQ